VGGRPIGTILLHDDVPLYRQLFYGIGRFPDAFMSTGAHFRRGSLGCYVMTVHRPNEVQALYHRESRDDRIGGAFIRFTQRIICKGPVHLGSRASGPPVAEGCSTLLMGSIDNLNSTSVNMHFRFWRFLNPGNHENQRKPGNLLRDEVRKLESGKPTVDISASLVSSQVKRRRGSGV
jgi:hypothetical protein